MDISPRSLILKRQHERDHSPKLSASNFNMVYTLFLILQTNEFTTNFQETSWDTTRKERKKKKGCLACMQQEKDQKVV